MEGENSATVENTDETKQMETDCDYLANNKICFVQGIDTNVSKEEIQGFFETRCGVVRYLQSQ